MAIYIFNMTANQTPMPGKPYLFGMGLPGSGAAKMEAMGKAYGATFGVGSDVPEYDAVSLRDVYGRPVFSDLRIQTKDGDEAQFINGLMTVEQTKTIVRTNMQGRDGSVFEYIAMTGYEITLSGSFFGQEYPQSDIEGLIEILKKAEPLKAYSKFLEMFSIYEVVCYYFKFPQESGREDLQPFEMKFASYSEHELILE